MKVVIADDSKHILTWLDEALGCYNEIEVVGRFENGTETLDGLRNLKPDLAIVDFRMPGLNGIEVLREIRKTDKNLKFILLTFFAFDNYRKLAMEAGADYFFSKFDEYEIFLQELATIIRNDSLKNIDTN